MSDIQTSDVTGGISSVGSIAGAVGVATGNPILAGVGYAISGIFGGWAEASKSEEASSQAITSATKWAAEDTAQANARYLFNNRLASNEIDQIDRELRNVLSDEARNAMKMEATTRAAIASTGFAGGTFDAIRDEAFYEQQFNSAVAWAKAENAFTQVQTNKLIEEITLSDKLDQINRNLEASTSEASMNVLSGWTTTLNSLSSAASSYANIYSR